MSFVVRVLAKTFAMICFYLVIFAMVGGLDSILNWSNLIWSELLG